MGKGTIRIPELDSLRGIAALCVMYYHYTHFFRFKLNYSFNEAFDFKYGHHGIELFFIISGFVIFMSLERISSVKEFIYKRFIRLFPTYWVCLSLTLLVVSLTANNDFRFSNFEKISNYLMFQGIFNIRNIDGSYWSLIPELCFYVMMIVLWKIKIIRKTLFISLFWLFIMYLAILKPSIIDVVLNLKFGMFFIIGMMFYKLKTKNNFFYPHVIIFISLITVYIVRESFETFVFSFLIIILFYLLINERLTFLNNSILILIGNISYPLYLLHQTIGFIAILSLMKLGLNDYLSIIIVTTIIFLLSWLIYNYFEKPILSKLRQYI